MGKTFHRSLQMKPKIVVSGVNIRKGGTLTIMRQCLKWLSESGLQKDYEIVAIVHNKNLYPYNGISFIEYPDSIRSWWKRLRYEYIEFRKLSEKLGNIELWLSLHDTSPRVKAKKLGVYCQTSYPFYRFRWRDFLMDYKIPLFSIFTKFVYRYNSRSTDLFIVQQRWFKDALSRMINKPASRFLLFPSFETNGDIEKQEIKSTENCDDTTTFFFPSTPDCHKNFESLLEASRILEKKLGTNKFKTIITLNGTENKYAAWLEKKWGDVSSIEFSGFMSKENLYSTYASVDCLVFPSLIESWGLPISEFISFNKPMILSDLPYAHETAAGAKCVSFVNTRSPKSVAAAMEMIINKDFSCFQPIKAPFKDASEASGWEEVFSHLGIG